MIIALGGVFGIEITKSAAKSILGGAAASIGGRTVSQFLVGWIPGIGNAVNATTAATITEGIGWYVANDFSEDAEKRRAEERKRKREQERREAEERKREQERREAEERKREQERREAEERRKIEARKLSMRQILMLFIASVLLAVICVFDCVVLERLNVSSSLVNIFSGIVIVIIIDAFIYSMCLRNIKEFERTAQIIFSSNFMAAVINAAGSMVYLAYDSKTRLLIKNLIAETNLNKGKFIIDSIIVLRNMPFLNLGLIIVVLCWFVFLVIRKHTMK